MSRRGNGEGSIYWNETRRRYEGLIDLGVDDATGKRVRRKVTGKTKTAVADRIKEIRGAGVTSCASITPQRLPAFHWQNHPRSRSNPRLSGTTGLEPGWDCGFPIERKALQHCRRITFRRAAVLPGTSVHHGELAAQNPRQ